MIFLPPIESKDISRLWLNFIEGRGSCIKREANMYALFKVVCTRPIDLFYNRHTQSMQSEKSNSFNRIYLGKPLRIKLISQVNTDALSTLRITQIYYW